MIDEQKIQRIEYLTKFLNDCNYHYYVENKPLISDVSFDKMLYELQTLEKETGHVLLESPTQRVGSDLQDGFGDVPRKRMMGSIENCYDINELRSWLDKFDNPIYIIEPKYDGTSCSIIYENGLLKVASTRGSGLVGVDITKNVMTIRNVPIRLIEHENNISFPSHIEIRGEILLPKSELVRINDERKSQGLETFANERNCAAGSIKQLDPKVTASRHLIFRPYAVYSDDEDFTNTYLQTQHDMLDIAHIFGFDAPVYWLSANKDDVIRIVEGFGEGFIHEQDFCMDGCVVKLDDYKLQQTFGYTQKTPRWAKAFKFEQEQESTVLKGVTVQMGMSGQLGFVAELEPVSVDGTVISRATLNNMDFINQMGLKIGQYVIVKRGGGVIPSIIGVDIEKTVSSNAVLKDIEYPDVCPFCGQPLVRLNEDGVNLYCTNEECEERMIQKLIYFVRKDCMNIDGLSEKRLRLFYKMGIVKRWQDLYTLTPSDVIDISGFTGYTANKLCDAIEKTRTQGEAYRSLKSLGIRMIGDVMSKNVMKSIGSIEKLLVMSREDMKSIDSVGDVAGDFLYEYVSAHQDDIKDVCRILPHEVSVEKSGDGRFSGMKFMATGSFKNFTRDTLKKSIEYYGGKYSSSISKNLNYLVFGTSGEVWKKEKANELGVSVISEDDYIKMTNGE